MPNVDANFECQQIGLVQHALVDDGVDFIAATLLIIYGVMLDVADDVLRLLALDAIADQGSGQNRIFAHVFEGAAVARLAGYVRAAAERHVVALGAELATDQGSVFASGLRIPTGSRP